MLQDLLMQQVKNAVMGHSDQQQHTGFDPSALLGQLSGLGGQQQGGGGFDLASVTNLIQEHAQDQAHTGFDPSALLGQVTGLFGQHAQQQQQQDNANVKSSDEDQYGDPGDASNSNFQNVKSSDEDKFGDPGAQ